MTRSRTYFTQFAEVGGRNDFLGRLTKGKALQSFGINPGGYIGFYNPKTREHDTFSLKGDRRARERPAPHHVLKYNRRVNSDMPGGTAGGKESDVAKIPKALHEHINTAFPAHVCLVGTVLPSGFAQVSPRGSTMVYDDEHLALWERGKGSTCDNLRDGTKVTVFLRKPTLRESGLLPKGGIARFYGIAQIHKSGAAYEEVWQRLVQPEKDRDPDKKGFAVLIKVERAEDLDGKPLDLA
jgi:hypothetical protein